MTVSNIDKLKTISTPSEENWLEKVEEFEKEDKKIDATIELLKQLGWKFKQYFNGRALWSKGTGTLFEHQGDIGILDDNGRFIYTTLSSVDVKLYTNIVDRIAEIEADPENHSYADFLAATNAQRSFINEKNQ